MIGLHPRAVGIEDAEAVGVAVGCQAHGRFLREHRLAQGTQIFLGHIGPRAVEENVAVRPQGLHGDAVRRERAIQVSRAAAVQSVRHNAEFRVAYRLEIHQLRQALEIGIARIDFLKGLVVWFRRCALTELGRARLRCRASLPEAPGRRRGPRISSPDIRPDCGWP